MKYKPLLLSPLGLIPMGLDHATAADMPVPVKAPQAVAYHAVLGRLLCRRECGHDQ